MEPCRLCRLGSAVYKLTWKESTSSAEGGEEVADSMDRDPLESGLELSSALEGNSLSACQVASHMLNALSPQCRIDVLSYQIAYQIEAFDTFFSDLEPLLALKGC